MPNAIRIASLAALASAVFPPAARGGIDSILQPLPAPLPAPVATAAGAAAKAAEKAVAAHPTARPAELRANAPVPTPPPPGESRGEAFTLTEATLIAHLRAVLKNHYEPTGELTLYPLRPWQPLRLASRYWDLEVLGYPGQGLASTLVLRFRLTHRGEVVDTFQLPLRCELWREAYFPRKRLGRFTALDPAGFDLRPVDLLRHRHPPVEAGTALEGMELVQAVSPSRPLYRHDIAPVPLVRKNAVVEVVASDGPLRITMKAQALEDGGPGAFISVRNLQSRQSIQAQVIDENTVKVVF